MLRKISMLAAVVAVGVLLVPAPAMAGCPGCKKVSDNGEGFCCGKGLAFGVKMASKALYEAVAGMKVEQDKMKCPGCKEAAKKNGRCEGCKVGLADGKAFKSPVAYRLAKGKPYTAEKAAHCPDCATAFKKNGFCTGCNAGFVAGRAFMDRESYDAATAAHKTLRKAAKTATKCEHCAVAMVNDGTCKGCKVSFKDGQSTKL